MRKLVSILVYILIINVLSAQNNFKPAVVIGFQNDTIKGLVDFRTNRLNATECRFKTSENAPERIFKPSEIAGYKLLKEGKYYFSHEIVVDSILRGYKFLKEGKYHFPQENAVDSLIRDTVFLEFLVGGSVNLYYYSDNENSDHYLFEKTKGELIDVVKKNDRITNLRVKVTNTWYSNSSNYNKNQNDENYHEVLKYVFRESKKISEKATSVDFERKDFIELTTRYNTEAGRNAVKNTVYSKDNLNTFFDAAFSVTAGVQYLDYVSVPAYLIQNYSIESQSIMPVIAGQLSVTSPRVSRSVAFIADLSLSRFTGACDYVGRYSTYFTYKYDALKAGVSFGLKYSYLENKTLQPFIEAELANSFFMFKSSILDIYDRYFNHEVKQNYLLPENIIGGFRFAIGCNYMLTACPARAEGIYL